MRTQEYKEEKKKEIMEKCFECYCDNGLRNTGIKELGKYCGMTSANLYSYFNNVDELIIHDKSRGRFYGTVTEKSAGYNAVHK